MKKYLLTYRFNIILSVAFAIFSIQELLSSFLGDGDFSKATTSLLVCLLSYELYKCKKGVKGNE